MSLLNFFFKRVIVVLVIFFIGKSSFLFCSHNTSRYFPFLERPAEYVLKKRSHLSPSLFLANASTAFKRGGGNTGIPELYGKYDLRDVIAGLEKVTGVGFINPIEQERGPVDDWIGKSIKYGVDGKLKARGVILNYEQRAKVSGHHLKCKHLFFGFSIPIFYLNASDNFTFLPNDSDYQLRNLLDGEFLQLDRIRRQVHNDLGLQGGDWNKAGVGDLDLHVGVNYNWDHKWLMRSIDLNFRLGTTIPTGVRSNINYPSSVSFMGDGHYSLFFDIVPEFELKQDIKIGLMLGMTYQFNNNRKLRLPVYQEPALFSALISDVKIDKGMSFKFSPYLIVANLTDGIDFQARYTYLRHNNDKWIDERWNPDVKSYLNQTVGTVMWEGKELTAEDISNNIAEKENLTRWRAHYLSLELDYDSRQAGNDWILDPIIYLNYDYQLNGSGSCKTHQLTLGAQVHF